MNVQLRRAFLVPVLSMIAAATAPAQEPDAVVLEYIAHASFRVHSPAGHTVAIDPYADRVWLGYDFPTDFGAPTVLITHPHYDHDGGRYRGLDVPWPKDTRVIDEPGRYSVGDLSIHGVQGKHADPYGKEFGQLNTIFVLEAAGVRIAHLGDNGPPTEDMVREMGRVDVLLLPIDGAYHILSADEIDRIVDAVHPAVVVPMHYRIPDLEMDPNSPSDLGPVDPWLEGREGVLQLDTHTYELRPGDLDGAPRVLVFRHSPEVPRPRSEGDPK